MRRSWRCRARRPASSLQPSSRGRALAMPRHKTGQPSSRTVGRDADPATGSRPLSSLPTHRGRRRTNMSVPCRERSVWRPMPEEVKADFRRSGAANAPTPLDRPSTSWSAQCACLSNGQYPSAFLVVVHGCRHVHRRAGRLSRRRAGIERRRRQPCGRACRPAGGRLVRDMVGLPNTAAARWSTAARWPTSSASLWRATPWPALTCARKVLQR